MIANASKGRYVNQPSAIVINASDVANEKERIAVAKPTSSRTSGMKDTGRARKGY